MSKVFDDTIVLATNGSMEHIADLFTDALKEGREQDAIDILKAMTVVNGKPPTSIIDGLTKLAADEGVGIEWSDDEGTFVLSENQPEQGNTSTTLH